MAQFWDISWSTLVYELGHGGPHINFILFHIIILLSILVVYYITKYTIRFLDGRLPISKRCMIHLVQGMPLLLGIILGIQISIPILDTPEYIAQKMDDITIVIFSGLATLTIAHILSEYLRYRLNRSGNSNNSTSILTTVIDIIVYLVGAMFLLEFYGISISPLMTALGVGGIASALALQDTLNNLFSGVSTLVSKQIHIGDYIKLSSGEEGRVIDMNWRNTTIRTSTNNMIIVPNKTIASSTLINYEQPYAECTISIPLTVVYGTKLNQAESIALHVAEEILLNSQYGVANGFKPVVQYRELGDYGIKMYVVLRIRNITDASAITSEFLKAIYKKFRQENIEFLVRKS